jgi:hypothetical protein
MAGLLGDIFSAADVAKRRLKDVAANPLLSAQQFFGNLNDKARNLNEMTAAAAREGIEYGPASQRLGGLLAEGYNPMGITVFHGSPAKFNKFDASKIGTGEGAQAYGYGHYVAESPETAKQYKETLKSRAFSKIVKRDRNVYDVVAPDGAVISQGTVLGKAHKAKDAYDANAGSLYEIDLPDEQIARMLDYDKPLSQQQKNVIEFFEPLVTKRKAIESQTSGPEWGDLAPARNYDPTGQELMQLLKSNDGMNTLSVLSGGTGGPETASILRAAGIPGIRYLDQNSRAGGAGTSNFVVFPGNENLLNIKKRNDDLLGLFD